MLTEYKNILVINLMHIGDLMLATPVFRTLRVNYPQARITLLADKKLRDLVEYNPHLDACLFLDKKGEDNHLWPFIKFICKVRRGKFDLVINLHRNERASALAAFSGAKRIIGYAKPFFSLWFAETMPNDHFSKHQVEVHFDVLRNFMGIEKIDNAGLEMVVPLEANHKARLLWQNEFPHGACVIAFHIGAAWLTKRWRTEYFAECADSLIARGYHIVFLGGPADKGLVDSCIEMMKFGSSERLHVLTGKLSLGMLAGVLLRSCLMLTNDSGPMHIGVAMNVPIVTMFGASPVTGFCPYDGKDVLLKTPETCHPCRKHECPLTGERNMACMKSIRPNKVMKYIDELLREYQSKPAYELSRPAGRYNCRVIELAKIEEYSGGIS